MTVRILQGDCRDLLAAMPDQSVHCCVTSPPYFGLRDYATGTWHGGVADHAHDTIGARGGRGGSGAPGKQTTGAMVERVPARECSCGAVYVDHQIGLEPTPDEFVSKLVEVFREVRRVLRDDGTLWLNLGDSYAGSWGAQSREHAGKHSPNVSQISANQVRAAQRKTSGTGSIPAGSGLKPKDLIGIPWMVAFALRADGWYLRQEIIWAKPNPMPESVRDRCTKSHEQIFLLSKSPTYYCDMEAIKEPVTQSTVSRLAQDVENQQGSDRVPGKTNGPMKAVGGRLAGNVNPPKGQRAYEAGDERQRTKAGLLDYAVRQRSKRDSFKRDDSKRAEVIPGQSVGTHRPDREESDYPLDNRNKRSVWTISTKPFKEAHFATFPPDLIEPCILAGSPRGGVILDPFGGAGTTGLVADRHQRDAVLCELNPEYVEIARARIQGDAPLLTELEAA